MQHERLLEKGEDRERTMLTKRSLVEESRVPPSVSSVKGETREMVAKTTVEDGYEQRVLCQW